MNVNVKITQPVAGVTVKLYLYDVDDPSSSQAPVDAELKVADNRGVSLSLGFILSAKTDFGGIARFGPIRLDGTKPGDNFRVVATVDPRMDLSTGVVAKKDDGQSAGVYFVATGDAVSDGQAATVRSDLLTIWRKLHIERDHMGAPSAGEVFPVDELFNTIGEVNPNGPIADLPLDDAITGFRPAYIEVVDDLAQWNADTVYPFIHNLLPEAGASLDFADAIRNVPSQAAFWTVQVIGAYEGPAGEDNDVNGEGLNFGITPTAGINAGLNLSTGRPIFVFTEVIRDVKADTTNFAGLVAEGELLKRVTYHEIVHQFGLIHTIPPGIGDEGPLNPANETAAAALPLTPNQLDHIREYGGPY